MTDFPEQYVYKVITGTSCLYMIKEYAEAYQMDTDSWKPTEEEAIAYYEQKMNEYVRNSVAALRQKLQNKQ